MPRYAAFLRGVNLGGRRKVGSAELKSCFEELGFGGAETFRTSGNVVFDAGREERAKLGKRVEQGLRASFGFDIEVFLRSAKEVGAIAAHEPFPPEQVERSDGKLQVALLRRQPAVAARKQVLALAGDEDRLAFGERELYWLPSGGTRDAQLDLKAIEQLTDAWTMRTKGTIELLAAKFLDG